MLAIVILGIVERNPHRLRNQLSITFASGELIGGSEALVFLLQFGRYFYPFGPQSLLMVTT